MFNLLDEYTLLQIFGCSFKLWYDIICDENTSLSIHLFAKFSIYLNSCERMMSMAVTVQKVEKWAQKKKITKIINKGLSNTNIEVRIAAIKALGNSGDENAMHQLIALLKDPDATIRTAAVEALGVMGNGRSLEFVKQMLNSENDEKVLEKVKWTINEIREKVALEEKN